MKLLRLGPKGQERPALITADGQLRDASSLVSDWSGNALNPRALAELAQRNTTHLPLAAPNMRIAPCVGNVGKIIGVGLNYADHAAEANLPMPNEPIWFLKATSSLSGPNDSIIIPRGGLKMDWEIELAIIIGRDASYVSEDEAPDFIAGYAIMNDVSERAFQLEKGTQWTKGKGCDSFGPLGPWLVTADEAGDVSNLSLKLNVNGVTHQNSNTRQMVFNVKQLVSYISHYMSLQPGDIIATGTPAGVGHVHKPPQYLQAGDVVELSIDRLGSQRQQVVAYSPAA